MSAETIRVGALRGIVMRGPAINETLAFYEENWGLKLARDDKDTIFLRGTGNEPFIYGLKNDPTYGIEYIHFAMPDRQSVEALHRQIGDRGGYVLGEPAEIGDGFGGYGFEMLDPDDRRLRFTCEIGIIDPIDDPVRPRKISHVVLNTPDMGGTEKFYIDVLGFRVSDYSADQMVFLRCSTDHHSIALVRGNYPSVNHVAFELPNIDGFMRSIGRMKQMGQVPSWGPGRHGPGDNPFAYFVSPSGFVIEFTSELQQIDEQAHIAQIWSRDNPENMDRWMTAGPPTPAMRAVMQGRPDPGFRHLRANS
ncbi:VOC family protein [Cucumibacter marinus]|uniref:VOC family protein n=1 Tax=Cucumibacter marinus TaxID=1121252 RepID=UPI000425802F|nr:VOC family protein [Cucumibacter marinus]